MLNSKDNNRRILDQVTELNGAIGTDSVFEGILRGKGNYKVAGRVVGDCLLDGALLLDKHGSWLGNIKADVVVIAGEVEGNVTAHKQLEISRTGSVKGDLTSPVIALDKGAAHQGKINMTGDGNASRFTERRR